MFAAFLQPVAGRVAQERSEQAGELDIVVTYAADTIDAAAEEAANQWGSRALLSDYTTQALALWAQPIEDAAQHRVLIVRGTLLYLLNETHNYTAAVIVGPALVADFERVLGLEDWQTLNTEQPPRRIPGGAGWMDEAIDLLIRTLTDCERVFGSDYPLTLSLRNNLAGTTPRSGAWMRRSIVPRVP